MRRKRRHIEGNRRLFIAEADSHAGHMLGLCNPATMLVDDNGDDLVGVHLGKFQKYLWRLRESYIKNVLDLAAGCEIIHGHVGDLTQGMKHASLLMGNCIDDQFAIAASNIGHIYERLDVTHGRLASGTAAHVWLGAAAEKSVKRLLDIRFPQKDIRILAHALMEIDGIVFDIAHHGPGAGIRQWTRGNVARHYLRSKMLQDFKAGKWPAKVYLRGHYHTFVHETIREQYHGEWVESHLIVLPSWCGMTEFYRQATKSEYEVINGLVAFEIIPGDQIPLRVHPMTKTLDLRTKERL